MPRISVENLSKLIEKGSEEKGLRTDLYVDSRGSDDNEGGKLDPFKTFNKAMEVVRDIPREVWVTIWFDPRMPSGYLRSGEHLVINRQRLNIRAFEHAASDTSSGRILMTDATSVYVGNATYDSYVAWYNAGGASATINYTAGSEAYTYTGQSLLEDGGLLVADTNWIDDTDEDNAHIWITGMYFLTDFNSFFVAADNTASGDLDFLRFTRCAFASSSGTNQLVYFGLVEGTYFENCNFFTSGTSNSRIVFDNSLRNVFKDCSGFSSGNQMIFVNHDASAYQGTKLALNTGVFANSRSTFKPTIDVHLGDRLDVGIWNFDTSDDLYFGSFLRRAKITARSFTCVGRVYFVDTDSFSDGMEISCRNFTIDRRNSTGTPSGNIIRRLDAEIVVFKEFDPGDVNFQIYALIAASLDVDDADTAGKLEIYGGISHVLTLVGSAASVTVTASAL